MSLSDVLYRITRSLRSWVSTTHRSYSQLLKFFVIKNPHEATGDTQPFGHIMVYIWY